MFIHRHVLLHAGCAAASLLALAVLAVNASNFDPSGALFARERAQEDQKLAGLIEETPGCAGFVQDGEAPPRLMKTIQITDAADCWQADARTLDPHVEQYNERIVEVLQWI